jgi:hypothetical protein
MFNICVAHSDAMQNLCICDETHWHSRRQLPLLKQFGLIFTNVPGTQAVRPAVESSGKIFDCADIGACGMLREITALEFLQHHFS